jgi:hypothetical protein
MQVSFRLLAQAKLLAKTKEHLDKEYSEEREHAKQRYMLHLNKIREEYVPAYAAMQRELNVFWEEVKEETGIEDERYYSVIDDGSVIRTTSLCGGLWDL